MKLRILAILSVVTMVPALYMIFLFAPMEVTQKDAQRIFYIHVPLAIIGAYGSAILLFIGCLGFLITRNLRWTASRRFRRNWVWSSRRRSFSRPSCGQSPSGVLGTPLTPAAS